MTTRTLAASAVSLCALVAMEACARNPVTGERELMLVSEAQEIAMGREAAGQIPQELGLLSDRDLVGLVQTQGMAIARASERPHLPWEFQVVDSPVVNAFALPGGFAYLTRGILAHMNSEAASWAMKSATSPPVTAHSRCRGHSSLRSASVWEWSSSPRCGRSATSFKAASVSCS